MIFHVQFTGFESKTLNIMDAANTHYRVRQCSRCPKDTEYYCVSCRADLCSSCKEGHVEDIHVKDHDVVIFSQKFNCMSQKCCTRHPRKCCIMYCENCKLPICNHCKEHKQHRTVNIRKTFEKQRKQHRTQINIIRYETLFYTRVLLRQTKNDVNLYHKKIIYNESEMFSKARRLKSKIDGALRYVMSKSGSLLKNKLQKQKMELIDYVRNVENYECIYEMSPDTPLQFLNLLKQMDMSKIKISLHLPEHTEFSFVELINAKNVLESLSKIQIIQKGKRCLENDQLLKLMPGPELQKSFRVKDVDCCLHFSHVVPDKVWVSGDGRNIILTNTTGESIHCQNDLGNFTHSSGLHTVNSEDELFYIDRNNNIKKLSNDMKTLETFFERPDLTWLTKCMHCSKFTGDLLIGVYNNDLKKGKIVRFNQYGELTQTIAHNNEGKYFYSDPTYIVENSNRDVVVCDMGRKCIVVTGEQGSHRFSYRGKDLEPRGICTDALSHILVCDHFIHAVQMLNKDGQFLKYLLTKTNGVMRPWSLSYDFIRNQLWVGSKENKISIYKYISEKEPLSGKSVIIFLLSTK